MNSRGHIVKVQLSELKGLVNKALINYGYSEEATVAISEVLLYAQTRGHNQGVVNLIGSGIPNEADGVIEVIKESRVSALLDAHQNHGMVTVNKATDMAMQKAHEHGIAIVGAHGINTS